MSLSPLAYLVISLFVGLSFGILLQKGRFCFVSAFRDFIAFKDTRVLKGVLAGVFVMTLFWSFQAATGYFRGFWTPVWGLGSIFGGFVFGLGMTMAGGCASGTLYRAGQGYVQFWITLLFMGVGFVIFAYFFPTFESLYFEPLNPAPGTSLYLEFPWSPAITGAGFVVLGVLFYAFIVGRNELPDEPAGPSPTAPGERAQLTIAARPLQAVTIGLRSLVDGTQRYARNVATDDRPLRVRLKDTWDARAVGVGMALVASLWFWVHGHWAITGSEARWAGWMLGQAGADVENVEYWGSVLFQEGDVGITIDMLMIASLIAGSFLAAWFSGDFRLRLPRKNRLHNPIVGGLLMGFGSRLAAGCNIANLFSGIALLSVHSFLAGAGIIIGVYAMTHWQYREVGCAF